MGIITDYSNLIADAKNHKIFTCLASDLLALSILKTPGELGADACVGNAQRFGVPFGFGGPSCGFLFNNRKI